MNASGLSSSIHTGLDIGLKLGWEIANKLKNNFEDDGDCSLGQVVTLTKKQTSTCIYDFKLSHISCDHWIKKEEGGLV